MGTSLLTDNKSK